MFSGATLIASDLRAGASLVVAALMAEGNSIIEKLHHIDRGYENFEYKIRFTRSSYACNNLYHSVMHSIYKVIQVFIAFYIHNRTHYNEIKA